MSLEWPKTSAMSRRSRRAAAAASSSASTTIRPPTMCRPPAKRSIAETSAFRQHGFVTCRRLSSSFTNAVSAMADILPSAAGSACTPADTARPSDVGGIRRTVSEGRIGAS